MAPEQVEGAPATPASDLYSLGVVFFELLTGKLPFQGDNPIAIRGSSACASRPPRRASSPRTWIRSGSRCCSGASSGIRRSASRTSRRSPARWRRALDGDLAAAALRDPAHPRPRRRLACVPRPLGARARRRGGPPLALAGSALRGAAPLSSMAARRTTAVLGFRNTSAQPQAEWLATALAETFAAELAAGGKLRVLPNDT